MKIAFSRTGLKIETGLYQAAQKFAGERGQSFAGYVTDLIAINLLENAEDVKDLPDIKRIRGARTYALASKHLRDEMRREAHQMLAQLDALKQGNADEGNSNAA